MSLHRKNAQRIHRRVLRVRGKFKNSGKYRISVFRSANHIYAQVIDDAQQHTVVSCSTLEMSDLSGDKKVVAQAIGRELARRAKEHGIESAVFDRGRFLYHGRVEALAEGLREGGLNI